MKIKNQFLSLLKFELSSANFVIWWFSGIILFQMLMFSKILGRTAHSSITMISSAGGFLMFMYCFIAIWIFFPKGMALMPGQNSARPTGQMDHSEFVLTRAIERKHLARAKTVTFWIVALLPLLVELGISFRNPDLTLLTFTSKNSDHISQEQYMAAFPSSHLETSDSSSSDKDLVIPYGQTFRSLWDLWKVWLTLCLSQGFCAWVMNSRFQKVIFWGGYASLLLWLISPVFFLSKPLHIFPSEEHVFFFFHSHMLLLFLGALALGVGVHLLYERQFQKVEVV